MFPIALGAADTAGVDLKMMSYALMLGASDFSTPFGYQTNLMVYGPGGYKVCLLYGRFSFGLFLALIIVDMILRRPPTTSRLGHLCNSPFG